MMIDRYLFRGKDISGKWHYGDAEWYLDDFVKIVNHKELEYGKKVIPETVGQCTGLKDKNGKLIFEGDIIKTKKYGKEIGHSNVNDFDIFKVVYETAVFRLETVHRAFNLVSNGNEIEIIGNIHDNPELLEVKE